MPKSKPPETTPEQEILLENIVINDVFNPFGASPEELLAGTLDENGLLGQGTRINGKPARKLCEAYYEKRSHFKESTRLGDLLVRVGLINSQQLQEALAAQKTLRLPLGAILTELGHCNQEQIEKALERQKNIREEFEAMENSRSRWRRLWSGFIGKLLGE